MDAQEHVKIAAEGRALLPLVAASGGPSNCERAFAVGLVDALLASHGAFRGDEVDALLDLRRLLSRAEEAREAVELFFRLRDQFADGHYVAFYRLRRWLEKHVRAEVLLNDDAEPLVTSVALDRNCLDAVYSAALIGAKPEVKVDHARVRLVFVTHAEAPQK